MKEMDNNVTMEKILFMFNNFNNAILESVNCIRVDMNNMREELKKEIKDLREENN